jgi:hypothetical protein
MENKEKKSSESNPNKEWLEHFNLLGVNLGIKVE